MPNADSGAWNRNIRTTANGGSGSQVLHALLIAFSTRTIQIFPSLCYCITQCGARTYVITYYCPIITSVSTYLLERTTVLKSPVLVRYFMIYIIAALQQHTHTQTHTFRRGEARTLSFPLRLNARPGSRGAVSLRYCFAGRIGRRRVCGFHLFGDRQLCRKLNELLLLLLAECSRSFSIFNRINTFE